MIDIWYNHLSQIAILETMNNNTWNNLTEKVVFGAALLNTQNYKIWINSKVEQSNKQ